MQKYIMMEYLLKQLYCRPGEELINRVGSFDRNFHNDLLISANYWHASNDIEEQSPDPNITLLSTSHLFRIYVKVSKRQRKNQLTRC